MAPRNQVRLPHTCAARPRRRTSLDRTGLDWTHIYSPIAAAVPSLGGRQAYLDSELCGAFPDGITCFSLIQAASDAANRAGLLHFRPSESRRRVRGR